MQQMQLWTFWAMRNAQRPLTRFANMPPCLVGTKRRHDTEYPDGKTFDRIKLQTRRVSRRFLKRVGSLHRISSVSIGSACRRP
jgi:hypothetical protein